MDIVVTVVLGVVSTYLAGILSYFYGKFAPQEKIRKLYSSVTFDSNQTVSIAIPPRTLEDNNQSGLTERISMEDMMASNYVDRTLSIAGTTEEKIRIIMADPKKQNSAFAGDANIVLICSPKTNSWTRLLYDKGKHPLLKKVVFSNEVDTSEAAGRWKIDFNGGAYPSRSFQQVIDARGKFDGKEFEDHAVIMKLTSPMGQGSVRRVLVIAGIRGFGTWGAGRYLRTNADDIYKIAKENDYAILLSVIYKDGKIVRTSYKGALLHTWLETIQPNAGIPEIGGHHLEIGGHQIGGHHSD